MPVGEPAGQRIILITGASRGIGRAVALALAGPNTHVIGLARSRKALEALDDAIADKGGVATLVPLDLTDLDGIDRLGGVLHERFGRLDGLVANAAVLGSLGPIQAVGKRSFEETVTVNLMANWRLLRSMDPLLRQSDTPRAVFLSSSVARKPRAFWGPYQASKAGMEAIALAWADENEHTALRVNIFDPGGTRTGMRAEAMPGEDPEILPTPEIVAEKLISLLLPHETRTGQLIRFKTL